MRIATAFLIALGALASVRGDPVLIVDNPLDSTIYGFTSHDGQNQVVYDYFNLAAGSSLSTIDWAGQFSSGLQGIQTAGGTFKVSIFADNPFAAVPTPSNPLATTDGPGSAVWSTTVFAQGTRTGIADPLQGGDIMNWSISAASLPLAAGRYWISVSATAGDPDYFLWNRSLSPDQYNVIVSGTNSLTPSLELLGNGPADNRMAFELWGNDPNSIPPPFVPIEVPVANVPDASATWVLLLAGFAGLLAFRKRF